MNTLPTFASIVLLISTATVLPAWAETRFVPAAEETSLIRVDGTSNVRDWHAETRDVQGELNLSAPGFWSGEGLDPKQLPRTAEEGLSFHVLIPAKSLDGDGNRFNNNLLEYIKAGEHETIRFDFTSLEADENETEGFTTRVTGNLTFVGVTKPLTFPVTWERDGDKLILRGEAEFKMSLFGISPPRMMMGTLRTADAVTVAFTWVLVPETTDALGKAEKEISP